MKKIKKLQEDVKCLMERKIMVSGMIEELRGKTRIHLGFDDCGDPKYADVKAVLYTLMRHLGLQIEHVPGKPDGLKIVKENKNEKDKEGRG